MIPFYMKQILSSLFTIVFICLNVTVFSQNNEHHIHHKNMNNEIVMLVTSTGTNDHQYIRSRIIPSARTWMKQLANVYVVLEDTFAVRFTMRHCQHSDHDKKVTSFTCPDNEPIYVLSRRCTSDYYNAESACCKFDEGINFVKSQKNIYDRMKFLIQGDDDMFWRVDQLARWLAVIDKSVNQSIPLVANVESSLAPGRTDWVGVWHIKNCTEIHGNGWYQPLMLNKAAVEAISVGTAEYGATETCKAFDLSQDSGLGVFFWLYNLNHIKFPGIEVNDRHKGVEIFKPFQMGVHYIKHDDIDDCEGKKWPSNLKYDQALSIGCGKLGTPSPFHNANVTADMYDAFEWFAKNGQNISVGIQNENDFIAVTVPYSADLHTFIMPRIRPLNGYLTTEHSRKYDITKEWRNFTLDDCEPKGAIDKHRNLRQRYKNIRQR